MNSRPNILIIQADQLAANYLGAYQNPIASTPHIDSLAANGAEFTSSIPTFDIYPGDFGWTGDWTEVRPRFANDVVTFSDAGVCLRADKVYSQWAYQDILGYHFPEE